MTMEQKISDIRKGISQYSEKGLPSIRNSTRNGLELNSGVGLSHSIASNISCSPFATLILPPTMFLGTRFSSILPTLYSRRVRHELSHRFL